jgi:hypothetical protein
MLEWASDRAVFLGRACVRLDCITDNASLRAYDAQIGFEERRGIEAHFPAPVGMLWLRRYEKRVLAHYTAAQQRLEPSAAGGMMSRHG